MIGISWRSIATRWPGLVGSFLALALGVALAAAAGLALVSAFAAPPKPPAWYVTADVVVAGPAHAGLGPEANPPPGSSALPPGERGYLPAETADRLAALGGTSRVVVDRAAYARLDQASEAHPWSASVLHAYTFLAGGPPATDDHIVLTAATDRQPGDTVSVATAFGPRQFIVSGVIRTEAPAAIYMTDPVAARLAHHRVAAVALFAVPGTDPSSLADTVRRTVADQPTLRVLTGDDRGQAEPDPQAGLLTATGALLGDTAGLAVFVSAFVVAGTFAFTVAQRRREFGLLRAAGATPRQIRRIVLGEALLIAAPAGLTGCALGAASAPPVAHWFAEVGLAPADFTIRFQPWPLGAAFGLGLLTAFTGAYAAARRASAIRPIEALREASVDSRVMNPIRWLLGLASLAGAVPLIPLLRSPEGPAYLLVVIMLLIVGCGLLAPTFLRPLVHVFSVGARSAARILSRDSALAATRRTAATATPVLVTMGLAGAALAGTATLSATQADNVRVHLTAPLVLTSGALPLTDTVTAEARQTSGINAAVAVKQTFAFDRTAAGIHQRTAWYVDGSGVLDLPLAGGSLTNLTGDAVAVSTSVADMHGWAIGTQASLWLSDGAPARLRVVAILADRLGLPTILLPWALASAHSATPLPDAIYLTPQPGTDQAAIASAAQTWGVTLKSTGEHLTTLDAEFDRLARLALLVVIAAALAYTGISVANTQLMTSASRAGDVITLRRAGATTGQVRRIIAAEALLTSAIGVTLGTAVTAATLAIVSAALNPTTVAIHVVVPWQPILAVAATCILLSTLASTAVAKAHRC